MLASLSRARVALVVLGTAALGAACSASGAAAFSGSSGAGGTAGTGTSASHASTGTGSFSTSASTGGASAGHDPTGALHVEIDAPPTNGTLVSTQTPDYYAFTGKQGDMLVLGAIAQGLSTNPNGYDPTVIDTYLTLLGPDQTAIAGDNDGWPSSSTDSQLFVTLPEDGTYYIEVEDCSAYAAAHPGVPCNDTDPSQVTTFDYQVFVYRTNALATPVEVAAGAEQDGSTGHAVEVPYALPAMANAGEYGFYVLDGAFRSTTDTHVFSFTPPLDTAIDTGERPRAELWVQPTGADDGDGSTSPIRATVTDDAAGKHVVAQVDQTDFTNGDDHSNGPLDLSFPITLGGTYYLFVESAAPTSSPATDYYFVEHFIGSYYVGQAELEGPSGQGENDDPGAAEMLALTSTGIYGVDGDISAPAAASQPDVDWFQMMVPASATGAFLLCEVDRAGSGLGGFSATLHDGKSPATVLGEPIGPEPASPKANFGNTSPIAVTGGATLLLELRAATQDPVNTGTAYRCFVQFQ